VLDRESQNEVDAVFAPETSAGIAELDPDGKVCVANHAFDLLLGDSSGSIRGKLPGKWINPNGLIDRIVREALQGRTGQPASGHLRRPDGQEIEVQLDWLARRGLDGAVCGVVLVVTDKSAQRVLEKALGETIQELNTVSRRLMEVREQERHHLARELHDEIGQQLTCLTLMLRRSDDTARSQAQDLVKDLLSRVRDLSLRLRPGLLDDLGLLPALVWLVDQTHTRTGLDVSLNHKGLEGRLDRRVEIAAFRIVQEALTNVVRHAGLVPVGVRVWREEASLFLEVEDQGTAFDPSVLTVKKGFGLEGMRERAVSLGGTWSIGTTSRGGTCVRARLPLESSISKDDTNVAVDRAGG
jgi:signal transduction histidine kinase